MAAVGDGINAYSPLEFYTRATDGRGHGERLTFKVPPDTYAQMMRLVADEGLPELTMIADVARDAIAHYLALRRSQTNDYRLREALDIYLRDISFREYTEEMKEKVEMWATLHDNVNHALTALCRDGAWDQVIAYIARARELASVVAEPYKTKTNELLDEWDKKVPKSARE
jgi:hypothetical protein